MVNDRMYKNFKEWLSSLQGGIFPITKLNISGEQNILLIKFNNSKVYFNTHGLTLNQVKNKLKDLVIDIYFVYEWDGQPLQLETIGILLGTTLEGAHTIVTKIMNNCKKKVYFLK